MGQLKDKNHDEIGERNEYGFPMTESQPGIDKGVWFEDANSGHWFKNLSESDEISAVRVDGVEFRKPEFWFTNLDGDVNAQQEFLDSLDEKPF